MPLLDNPRHESFAQARAGGARLDEAYEDAGFNPGNGHAGRLARRPDVAERITELRAARIQMTEAGAPAMIGVLLRLVQASEDIGTPAGVREARLTLAEIRRLRLQLSRDRAEDRAQIAFDSEFLGESEA